MFQSIFCIISIICTMFRCSFSFLVLVSQANGFCGVRHSLAWTLVQTARFTEKLRARQRRTRDMRRHSAAVQFNGAKARSRETRASPPSPPPPLAGHICRTDGGPSGTVPRIPGTRKRRSSHLHMHNLYVPHRSAVSLHNTTSCKWTWARIRFTYIKASPLLRRTGWPKFSLAA